MRKFVVLLFFLAALTCGYLLYTDVPLAPKIGAADNMPRQLRDDIAYVQQNRTGRSIGLFFTHRGGFYNTPISVGISYDDMEAAIYYTLDGSTPDESSPRYVKPLEVPAPDSKSSPFGGVACTVLKVVAIKGESRSQAHTQSYFVGTGVDSRFPSYVFSLSTNADNLYDYERGILVPGKIYDDYMKKTKTPDPLPLRPANYNQRGTEWERPAFVEVFTPDGNRTVAQNIGLRVHGNFSRAFPQKPLRLLPRKKYEPKRGSFETVFFPELVHDNVYKAPLRQYETMVLSGGGSVYSQTVLVDPLVSRIIGKVGYPALSPMRAAAVYLNGEYYGPSWLAVRQDERFLRKLYQQPGGAFEIIRGGLHRMSAENQPMRRYEFWRLTQAAKQGLDNADALREFESRIDVHNMLLYTAIEIFVGNDDWPRNNVKVWRYAGADENAILHPELDGRLRYLLYDTERSMGTMSPDGPGHRGHVAFRYISYMTDEFVLFGGVMRRKAFRDEFANYICDLALVHFSEKNVAETLADLVREIVPEYELVARAASNDSERSIMRRVQTERDTIVEFCRKRPDALLGELRELFGYTSLFRITLDGPGRINTVTSGEGWYFAESTVPLTPVLPKWRKFEHWLVNGEKHTEETLLVSGKDAINGQVAVTLVSREEIPALFLADAYDRGDICGFSLHNSTAGTVQAQGLYLSDKRHELKKWPLPDLAVAAGGKADLVGQSFRSTEAMLKVRLNFNPRRGEVVFLSTEAGEILDYLIVP